MRHIYLTIALALISMPGPAFAATPALSHCSFTAADQRSKGGCGKLEDETPVMTLAPAKGITSGIWREDSHPSAVWAGEMTTDDDPHSPIELELYGDGRGILRSNFVWYPVTNFTASPGLSFDIDASHEVAPGPLDAKILQRAAAILATTAVWNRADNRKCPPDASTWSVFCAMEKATAEVTGAVHHRRPAMEVVRVIVEERSAGRNYAHRLMGYNNDHHHPCGHAEPVPGSAGGDERPGMVGEARVQCAGDLNNRGSGALRRIRPYTATPPPARRTPATTGGGAGSTGDSPGRAGTSPPARA